MNPDEAERWKVMIHEDLTRARVCLRVQSAASEDYLQARIAEDHAILARLGVTALQIGASDPVYQPATALA
jgi:hypothetical protein